MITLIKKSKLKYFAYYCWAAGLLSILLLVR
jgi:undecaprenyl pyrophosphate phosphatase UppP